MAEKFMMESMIKRIFWVTLLLLTAMPTLCHQPASGPIDVTPLRYNYTYKMTNNIRENILLFFKVRIYYVISASVKFTTQPTDNGNLHFKFEDINGTGYKIRTFRNGKHFILITADYDAEKNNRFIEAKIQHYRKNIPAWSKYMQKIKRHPLLITTRGEDVIQFTRNPNGTHHDLINRMKLTRLNPEQFFDNIINIYETMMKTLEFYDHTAFPRSNHKNLSTHKDRTWLSPSLNYTDRIATIIRLLFRKKDLKPWGKFNQQEDFRLTYKITGPNDRYTEITGEAFPGEKVWRFIRMNRVVRKIKLRRSDNVLLEDSFSIDLRDKKGMGQHIETKLKLIESN